MKKMNVLMSAAVAGLFAVSANAADAKKAAAPTTEKECTEHKMTWKDGKCSCATKNGCKTAAAPAASAPAATAPAAAAPAAPATK